VLLDKPHEAINQSVKVGRKIAPPKCDRKGDPQVSAASLPHLPILLMKKA